MSEVTFYDAPLLNRPLLLIAFSGLFDAADAATDSLAWIKDRSDCERVAKISSETFMNFQHARPRARFSEDGARTIDWPDTTIWSCQREGTRDVLVMLGVEPHLRWQSYSDSVLTVARRTGAEMVVTVGSMVSMVPHTRPLAVTGSAADSELARRLHLGNPTYQGPTGLVGVLNQRLDASRFPVVSLRVSVPHYVPSPPNPKATRALLRRLQQTTGIQTGYEDLDSAVSEWVMRVDQAVASDGESREYVEGLEHQVDSDEQLLPSGDDLAAELEAFLRERPEQPDDGDS
jgi:proteasome assembly chaperone (PAC2) family protein